MAGELALLLPSLLFFDFVDSRVDGFHLGDHVGSGAHKGDADGENKQVVSVDSKHVVEHVFDVAAPSRSANAPHVANKDLVGVGADVVGLIGVFDPHLLGQIRSSRRAKGGVNEALGRRMVVDHFAVAVHVVWMGVDVHMEAALVVASAPLEALLIGVAVGRGDDSQRNQEKKKKERDFHFLISSRSQLRSFRV